MKKLTLWTLCLATIMSLYSIAAQAQNVSEADACKNSPPPKSFIIVKEDSAGTITDKGNEYVITTSAPQVTFISEDPCAKKKLAKISSHDFATINKMLDSYDRYVIVSGNHGASTLLGKVTKIYMNGDNYSYHLTKVWDNGQSLSGNVSDLKIFLMEVEYKDLRLWGITG